MANNSFIGISRIVGYSLFLMAIFNWVDILLPPQFMNPTWELESVGAFIESMPIIFLSLVLIFYGDGHQRAALEKVLVRILSLMCLALALFCFLLVPVAASSTIRINQQIDAQFGAMFDQQMDQINELEEQLSQASNQDIIEVLENQGIPVENDLSEPPKEKLLSSLVEVRQNVQTQTTDGKLSRQNATLKSAVKWIIGCCVSGFTFLFLWRLTRWARTQSSRKRAMVKA